MNTCVLCVFLLSVHTCSAKITTNNTLSALKSQLFANYDVETRPDCNIGDPTTVVINVDIQQILKVVPRDHKVSMELTVYLKWEDCDLTWDPRDYKNVTYISVPDEKAWKPDIRVVNGIYEAISNFGSLIFHNGTVLYSFQLIVDTKCRVNIEKFPFDSQTCYASFASWTQDFSAIDLRLGNSAPNIDQMYTHEEWKIHSTGVNRGLISLNRLDNVFVAVEYYFQLERRPTYYEENVLLPVVIFIIVMLSTFLISPGGEAIGLSTNILLSFTVLLSFVSDELPKSSKSTCWFTVFLIFIFSIFGMTTLFHVISLSIHAREDSMPKWIENYILRPLTIITKCSSKNDRLIRASDSEKWQMLAKQLNRVTFCLVSLSVIIGSNYLFYQIREMPALFDPTQINSSLNATHSGSEKRV